ncbi:calcium-activated potassium channel subunit beta-4-like [Morone saxatilis]|uniref:calcium-activated potassium channel subunit beta-4-like n=1 Tax=Morone saxatilis TaxID=34816 RepID=UPI0015E22A3E|nr:calcium-activated potassium channel subunit beta-4-like [Morone saxatilis]
MAKMRVSYEYSEAEDKSIRLGLFLIACGILSLFILGFCWLSPTLQSLQSKPANCTVVSVLRPEEMFECVFTCGTDCKGTSLYPCLQIFVNNSESNSVALLHFDEQQLVLNPKSESCSLLLLVSQWEQISAASGTSGSSLQQQSKYRGERRRVIDAAQSPW